MFLIKSMLRFKSVYLSFFFFLATARIDFLPWSHFFSGARSARTLRRTPLTRLSRRSGASIALVFGAAGMPR
jgi:hypothetical protein